MTDIQKMRVQEQAWKFSDVIDGCAINNNHTSQHHQVFTIEKLPDSLYRLNYVICYPGKDYLIQEAIPTNFIDLATSRAPLRIKEARYQLDAFTNILIAQEKEEMFIDDEYKQGINIALDIDPSRGYKIIGTNIRNCSARVESLITYKQANNGLNRNSFEDQLRFLNKFVTHQKLGNRPKDFMLPFEDAVNLTTKIAQQTAKEAALKDNIQCVLRRRILSNNRTDKYCYTNTENSKNPKAAMYHWTVPITTSRLLVPALNEMAFFHFNANKTNLFTPELSEAFSLMAPYARERKGLKRLFA